nr:putative ribonuclease H-like domain-containing protein [Tanacetum cinerariifolium]
MDAVIRIISYLKGTAGHGILFGSNGHLDIRIYTDADWAGDKDKRRSTSGYFSLVGGNLVTWRSKKQKVVALSSAEAEFRGIANGVAEALWIRKLVSEIGQHHIEAQTVTETEEQRKEPIKEQSKEFQPFQPIPLLASIFNSL